MSDLISRKALLEAHQDLVAFGTDTTFAVRNLITNAPAIEQGESVAYRHEVYFNGRHTDTWYDNIKNPASDTVITPLYTAPPQPQTVKDALEKAARICEKMQKDENNTHIGERCSYGTCQIQGSTFAKAIRALIKD